MQARIISNVHGIKADVGKFGDAYTLCVWLDGNACYGIFGTLEALGAWVKDNRHALDKFEADTVVNVYALDEAA